MMVKSRHALITSMAMSHSQRLIDLTNTAVPLYLWNSLDYSFGLGVSIQLFLFSELDLRRHIAVNLQLSEILMSDHTVDTLLFACKFAHLILIDRDWNLYFFDIIVIFALIKLFPIDLGLFLLNFSLNLFFAFEERKVAQHYHSLM